MSIKDIAHKYKSHPNYQQVLEKFESKDKINLHLNGLSGSSFALFSSTILENLNNLNLFVLTEKEEAAYFYNDLLNLIDENKVLFFPSSYKRAIQYGHTDEGNIILRTNTLNRLDQYQEGLLVIVTYTEAISEKVISRSRLTGDTLQLNIGEKVSIDFIKEVLDTYQFDQVDFVFSPGQYAVRGSIIDIFSFSAEYPFRIDFFGDEVDSIRSFDLESQLSKAKFDRIAILPNILNYAGTEVHQSIFEFAENRPLLWSNNLNYIAEKLSDIESSVSEKPYELFKEDEFKTSFNVLTTIEFGTRSVFDSSVTFSFHASHQPLFQKNFNKLGDNLLQLINDGFETYILSENEKQLNRLNDIFKDTHKGIPFIGVTETVHEGFIDHDLKLCCFTDHQIFDRYHKYRINQYFSAEASVSLNELKDLKPGDYVVHIDHGIGKFGGLEKIVVNGKVQEAIKLVYRDNDVLYVNIHSLHRISKYKGKDDSEPKIYKLGSGAWQKLKQSTKSKVKDIAKDLIALYAKRKAEEGFRFSADTYMQEELEASFIYEDTPDQVKATVAVKGDMESGMPMDRLVCGDVGFGKTEIAVRAAFKAVSDSKQVAILVPTTILALQHYNTFKERLKDFPCRVDYISRLRKTSDQTATLKDVESGKVDILIGTHRLLGKDIKFKDLGLLIIDEEQKFGVAAKEKLKALRVNIDTLTLTATPIPRTLQFSLMGARDLSVINTPPPNRHPIVTEAHNFNESIIMEGINFELSRGGQVFFIHNRIQNIFEVETLIRKLCPKAKTIVGHGQMDGPKLEQTMIDFINGDYDVLIATAIIESGLDIPNANTIFINNAQNFGLSDLHQLRGRVGRSNRKAFCYLLAPPVVSLTPEARRRLKAIEEFSDLGSGFNISLQDLDIRGAGNMLGAEQSGFIADIGFETYNRILNEAMLELRETEFKDLFAKEETEPETEEISVNYATDCSVDTDLEIHIPDEYISNIAERIRLYRQLDSFEREEQLTEFRATLIDRFGKIPQPTEDLLGVVRLRWLAQSLGFEKVVLKNQKMIGYFVNNQNSAYFSSKTFAKILNFVQRYPDIFRMKENKHKLTLSFEDIKTIDDAYNMLNRMKTNDIP